MIFPSLYLLVSTQDTAYDMYKTTYVLKHRVDMMIPFHGPLCLPFLECASLQRHDFFSPWLVITILLGMPAIGRIFGSIVWFFLCIFSP